MVAETKAIAVLFRAAPIFAGLAIIASLQTDSDSSAATWLWRTALTVLITIFTTLVGILYRDLRAWIRRVEETNAERHKQNSEAILIVANKFERMTGVITMIPLVGSNASVEEKLRLIQEVRSVLER